jgi:hypothetical protein
MRFCERFGITPRDFRAQPARDVMQWLHYMTIENKAAATRSRIADAKARMRS